MNQDKAEEMIKLIYRGYDLASISFEFDIPIEELEKCEQRLNLRMFVKQAIAEDNINEAIRKLQDYIESTDNNIVEKLMLLKLKSYASKTLIDKDELKKLDEEKERLNFSNSIDQILNELDIKIPKIKPSNIKKKVKKSLNKRQVVETVPQKILKTQDSKGYYQELINKYKEQIDRIGPNHGEIYNLRNKLAFAYFKSNMIDEARNELLSIIEQSGNYTAYRQLVNLEKTEGNIEDAKLWAWDCADKFPKAIQIRETIISIARKEHDSGEMIKRLNEISIICPQNEKVRKMLSDKKIRKMIDEISDEER